MPVGFGNTVRARPRMGMHRRTGMRPRPVANSYVTIGGNQYIIKHAGGLVTQADVRKAYKKAGIGNGNVDPHTLTFGPNATTIDANVSGQAVTEVTFWWRCGNLKLRKDAFKNRENITTVTFGNVKGNLDIGQNAFLLEDNSSLTTLTFRNVRGNMTIGANAFKIVGDLPLTVLRFGHVYGNLTIGTEAFAVTGGTSSASVQSIVFTRVYRNLTIGSNAFTQDALTTNLVRVSINHVGGSLTIDTEAFSQTFASLTTVSIGPVGKDLTMNTEAFNLTANFDTLHTVTFSTVGRNFSLANVAFPFQTFVNATGSGRGVRFPTGIGGSTTIGVGPFLNADPTVQLSGSGAQLSAVTTGTDVTGQHYYI
jgi:hypothetical protein